MMQEWADKLGKGGSRIRVELIALSKPRGLNSFLNVRFVPEADIADIFMLFNGFTLAGLSPLNLMHRADQKRTYVVGDNHVAIRQPTDADDPASPLQQRR